jgi:alpha-amylase
VGDARLLFCFGVHDHQPVGNFDHVVEDATARAYHPLLVRLHERPEVRLTIHVSGGLLAWLRERAPRTFDLLGALAARGQAELLSGGFYEPILAVLPDADARGQIEHLSDFLTAHFGIRPRGLWLAERVWEPHLPRTLAAAGIEYVLLDDHHFALAGLDPERLGGSYVTEDRGATLRVVPISQRLRYLIPFAPPEAALDYLDTRRGATPAVTMVDDGEKFGVWPGTHAHVYAEGWLDRFFDRVLATDWITLATLGEMIDRTPAAGRVYLPTAAYREMGEWALPVEAARALTEARQALEALPDGSRLAGRLHGGFWRSFLAKYPEVADTYGKMLRLSDAVQEAAGRRPGDARVAEARAALWRGQANDAYWHGIFGGCYLPHLRRAVRGALLECERHLVQATAAPALTWSRAAIDDGDHAAILVRTEVLAITVRPALGGAVTELGHLPRALDLGDVLARRPEAYHAEVRARATAAAHERVQTIHATPMAKETGLDTLLQYDDRRRASLLEGWFAPTGPLDPITPWPAARSLFAPAGRPAEVRTAGEALVIRLAEASGEGTVAVDKEIRIHGNVVRARYRLRRAGPTGQGRWGVQWNLALTAGDAPGRYLTLPGHPAPASRGRAETVDEVGLVDEWIGLEARLALRPAAALGWGPVETVSLSEGGFERIYQGTALLALWPVDLGADAEAVIEATLVVETR